MNLPNKQQAILDECRKTGEITIARACELLREFYYSNHQKYVSEILEKMIKSGKLTRVRPGVFIIGAARTDVVIKNQGGLF